MALLKGREIANKRTEKIKEEVHQLVSGGKRVPTLAVILVGDDPASETYVKSKARQCKKVGMNSKTLIFDKTIDEDTLIQEINELNNKNEIDGILVQLPLPKHLDEARVIDSISPFKDVDGLHPENVGLLEINQKRFVPCTPLGIMHLLEAYDIDVSGKDALVIGRSRLVGNPIATLLKNNDATVTQAHSKTMDLKEKISQNEIIVVAIGKQEFITEDMVNSKHIIIDVGIHREDGKLYGDVSKKVYEKVSYITPVPKGVGPMTIISLLENTLLAYNLKGDNDEI